MFRLLSTAAALGAALGADAPDLSPETWSAEDWATWSALETSNGGSYGVYEGAGPVVAGTSSALAVKSGADALAKGGSAMDACMTTALTQVALVGGQYVSYAGILNVLYFDAASNETHNLNGVWDSVPGTDPTKLLSGGYDNFTPPDGAYPAGASVLVHGFMRGVEAALARFGSGWPWATYFEPAVYFSEQGFEPTDLLRNNVRASEHLLNQSDTGRAYLDWAASGAANITQPEQAAFLRRVQEEGADYMYTGAWAAAAVEAVQAAGGNLTAADLAAYAPTWVAPRELPFGLRSTGAPEYGGGALLEQLRLVERMGAPSDLAQLLLFDRWRRVYDIFVKEDNGLSVMQAYFPEVVTADVTDLDAYRASDEYIDALWAALTDEPETLLAQIDALFGGPGGRQGERGSHSDAVVARDAAGNVCSMVHTLNADPWGTGIFVEGVALATGASSNTIVLKRADVAGTQSRVGGPLMPVLAADGSLALSVVADSLQMDTLQILVAHLVDGAASALDAVAGPKFALWPDIPCGSVLYSSASADDCAGDAGCLFLNATRGPFSAAQIDALADAPVRPYVEVLPVSDVQAYYHFGLPVFMLEGEAVSSAIVNGGAAGV